MRNARILVGLVLVLLALAAFSGGFLVIAQPRKADVILALAGETDRRPVRALELLAQGYANRVILDVPAGVQIYRWSQIELAQKYIETLPEAQRISVCPIQGLSTYDEAKDAAAVCSRSVVVMSCW